MIKLITFVFLVFGAGKLLAQPNCEAYKYYGDTLKYKACIKAEERKGHYQFSRAYQTALDKALEIDSTFAYAYRAKSVAYLKSGDFITWKMLMDKAVEYDPKENLGYRGWCRYQFFRDYRGAIEDIERLDSLVNYNIGFSVNGDYHLNIAKALCYKALGEKVKAIQIIQKQMADKKHFAAKYDYLHLGVLYLETGEYQKALSTFKLQSKENEIAENQHYTALTYLALDDKSSAKAHLRKAKELYQKRQRMFDPYTHPMDKIFLEDIEQAFQNIN